MRRTVFTGFNPCCLGLAVLGRDLPLGGVFQVKFQSLLSWISRIGAAMTAEALLSRLKFQSLLSWISRIGVAY